MKKQLTIIAMGLALVGVSPLAVAGSHTPYLQKKTLAPQHSIILYAKPSTASRVVAAINPYRARLVPIFNQGEWVKVGSANDGKVGWLNKKQYFQAMRAAVVAQKAHYIKVNEVEAPGHQPQVKVFYDGKPLESAQQAEKVNDIVVKSVRGANGKVQIVAYKNGKKLPPEQAKRLYQQMLGPMMMSQSATGIKRPNVTMEGPGPQYVAQSYRMPVPPQVEQMMVESMQQFYRMDRALMQQRAVSPAPVSMGTQQVAAGPQQPMKVVVVPVYRSNNN